MGRQEYIHQLYEQAAREQRELAQRVRAASAGRGALAADFERRAAKLEIELARVGSSPRGLQSSAHGLTSPVSRG